MTYNITADDRTTMVDASEITANANGPRIRVCGTDIVCRVAYNQRGWVTAVSAKGLIVQGWAGMFCAA